MPVATINSFTGGLVVRPDPYLIQGHEAVFASNAMLRHGAVRPRNNVAGTGISFPVGTKSIYKWGDQWVSSTTDRWYVEAGDVIYWADGGTPMKRQGDDEARLGVKTPGLLTASKINYAVTAGYYPEDRFTEQQIRYVASFYSDPLAPTPAGKLEGWGCESVPSNEVVIDQTAGQLFVDAIAGEQSLTLVGDANYPPGGSDGFLHTFSNTSYSTVMAAVTAGGKTFTLGQVNGLAVGQYISIKSGLNQQYDKITAIDTGAKTVTVATGLSYDVAVGNTVHLGAAVRVGDEVVSYGMVIKGSELGGGDYSWFLMGIKQPDGTAGLAATKSKGTAVSAIVTSVELAVPKVSETLETDQQINVRNLYRVSGEEFKLVEALYDSDYPGAITYTDTKPDAELGAILVSDLWAEPPDLTGLAGPYIGCLIGWKGNEVFVSEQGNLDAWNPDYTVNLPYDVTACVVHGSFVVIFTAGGIYTLSGYSPDSLYLNEAISEYGCIYPRSIVSISRGLLFLAPQGICAFDGLRCENLSYDKLGADYGFFDQPESCWAAYFDEQYLLFSSDGCVVMDINGKTPIFSTAGFLANCGFKPQDENTLYMAYEDVLYRWGTGEPVLWYYHTGELEAGSLAQEKIVHSITLHYEGSVSVEMLIDGQRKHYKSLSGERRAHRMRVTGSSRGYRIQFKFTGTGTLYGLDVEYTGPNRKR